ncbi:MAG: condensation domain-containing protein [Sulfitobacter sp.]
MMPAHRDNGSEEAFADQVTGPKVYAVTDKQRFILDQAVHPYCPDDLRDRWLMTNAFLVHPGIDDRRLRRAVQKLRERHDVLRMRFIQTKGKWQALIDPPGADTLRYIDLGDVDDATFDREIRAIAYAPMTIVGEPLGEVIVVKCGTRGDVLVTRVHHTLTDGYGIVVLTEDLTRLLLGMPLEGEAMPFATYLTQYAEPSPVRTKKAEAFWRDLHHDFPKAPNVGRLRKGLPPLQGGLGELDTRQMTFTASPKSLRAFETRMAKAGLSTSSAFFAAHLEAICQIYSLDKLMFMTHTTLSNPELDKYAGDRTCDLVLPYLPVGKDRIEDGMRAVGELILKAMAHLPSKYALRNSEHETRLIDAGCYPDQFSVHHPRPMKRQERSVFREGFFVEQGQEQILGPYTITSLDLSCVRRITFEMQLTLAEERISTGFDIHFDGIAYTEEEVRKIGETLCDLLDLKMTKAVTL